MSLVLHHFPIHLLVKIDQQLLMQLGKTNIQQTSLFIILSHSSTAVLYDINTQKQDFIINTARKAITSLALSPDGRYLATGEVKMPLKFTWRSLFFVCISVDTILKFVFGIYWVIRRFQSIWVIINSPLILW